MDTRKWIDCVVQLLSHIWLCDIKDCSTVRILSFTISWSLIKLMSIESVMLSNHLVLCCSPLLLPLIFPSISSPVSQLFATASASASFLLMNIKDWFPLGLTGLIFLLSKGISRVFSSTTIPKYQSFSAQPSSWSNSHIHTIYDLNHLRVSCICNAPLPLSISVYIILPL